MKNSNGVILDIKDINKSFAGVKALKNINLAIKKGQIHGIVGENGAGKSTLLNIIIGLLRPDSGQIVINDKSYTHLNTRLTKKLGIAMVHQNLSLFPNFTIAENLFFNDWSKNKVKIINWKKTNLNAKDFLNRIGLDLNPQKLLGDLSYIDKQMIEIARNLFLLNHRVIILDEPTAALSAQEISMLFEFIKKLKSEGVTFLYVSHFLEEIFNICDRVTVLRDGKHIFTGNTDDISMNELINHMVGTDVNLYPQRDNIVSTEYILEVKNLRKDPFFKDVNFGLFKNEVLGLAGLKGSGKDEIARIISGLDKPDAGLICIEGKKHKKIYNSSKALNLGIGYLSNDRFKWGIIPLLTVRENISLSFLKKIRYFFGLINLRKEKKSVNEYINELKIKTPSSEQVIKNLSGGNQQKAIFARLLGANPKIFILNDPTFGIDVKSKMDIHQIINEISIRGCSTILISSDFSEILGVCDRILLLKNGAISGEYKKGQLNLKKLKDLLEEGLGNGK